MEKVTRSEHDRNARLHELRVLVAEDNLINQFIIKRILSKWEIVPILASDGLDAIEKFKANCFDVVFLDIQMPLLNGIEAARSIRNLCLNTKLIALSAAMIDSEVERAKEAGISEFIVKPFDSETIEKVLLALVPIPMRP